MAKYREIRGLKGSEVYRFTSSLGHDRVIARFAAAVAIAHIEELARLGIISRSGAERMARTVLKVACSPPSEGYEDIWEAMEDYMAREVGEEAKWYPLGRSRNDQVAAALRLYVALETLNIALKALEASRALALKALSEDGYLPGYTHGEPAFALSWPCLLAAYAESLLEAAFFVLESSSLSLARSPLGAAAGAGTSAPLDEERLASRLGFSGVYVSPYYAVASRGFLEAAALSLGLLCLEASRIAEDLIQLHGERLVEIPEGHIATSSMIPHKENPVTLEIARARASECLGKAFTAALIPLKLRYSYNLDLQEANRVFTETVTAASVAVEVLGDLAPKLKLNYERASAALKEARPFSGEEAERLSLERGVPFRDAYAAAAAGASSWTPEEAVGSKRTGCAPARLKARVKAMASEIEGLVERVAEKLRLLESRLPKCG